ncbi:MAG: hypothetical protein GOU97_01815 [Nanoarchaeota archaeon]|nr:hypothetical protein [Nanoarchaeota archaeon]
MTYDEQCLKHLNEDKNWFQEGCGFGVLGGFSSTSFVHEGSHLFTAQALGFDASLRFENGLFFTHVTSLPSPLELGLIVGAGYAGNLAASALAFGLARRSDNPLIKGLGYSFSASQILLTLHALSCDFLAFGDRDVAGIGASSDLTRLSDLGVPLVLSLTAYLLPMALVLYSCFKGSKDYYSGLIKRGEELSKILK